MSEKSQRRKERKAEVRSREAARVRARRMALVITGVIVVIVIAGAVILSVRASRSAAPAASSAALPATAPASSSSTAQAAPTGAVTDLEKAADAVGFVVTTGANVGVIENLPADTTLIAPSRTLLPVGAMAPDFTVAAPDGKLVTLSQFRGKTVFLEFFATWCPHCQAEAPHLLQVYNKLPSSSVVFLSVNGDSEDAASVHAFTRHFGLPWGAYLDPGSPIGSFRQQGGVGPVSRAYGLALFPTFYIIDARGRVAWRADREQPDALILQKLRDVIGS